MAMDRQLLVRGRWVVTGGDPEDSVLTDGAIAIAGGVIREVGGWESMRTRYPTAPVLGSAETAVLPGLINAHHHSSGVTHLQQGIADDLLELWLLELRRARAADPYLGTLLSASRLLRSGVTSVVELYECRGPLDDCEAGIRRALTAYGEAGMRVAFAPGIRDQNHLVSARDEAEVARFLDALPAAARQAADAELPTPNYIDTAGYFALMEALWLDYRHHPRIEVWFGPPGPNWVSDRFMQECAARAAAYGVGIQTHLSESVYEKLHGPRAHGRPVLVHLQSLGVLGPRFSIAHGVWLT